jgi:hypothetical protein
MQIEKPTTFQILGYEAVLLGRRIEVSVPDEAIATEILYKFANAILDGKLQSLRINLPNKIIFVSAQNKQDLLIRADYANNKKAVN